MPEQYDVIQRLKSSLKWNGDVHLGLTWDEVEYEVGYAFPLDYKSLMTQFPSGEYGQKFYVYSPIQGPEWLKRFKERKDLAYDTMNTVIEDDPAEFPYPVFPSLGGLLPWGIGDDEVFCWKVDDVSRPDEWTVVFGNPVALEWGEYPGPVSNFLLDAILGNFTEHALYYEPAPEKAIFTPYTKA